MFGRIINDTNYAKTMSEEDIQRIAALVREMKAADRTLGVILQYVIDTAADQYIGENFHHYAPALLKFFVLCGTDNEEVLFLSFVESHKDSLVCRNQKCDHYPLVGQCPLMYCPECERRYFIDAGPLTERVCVRCAAYGKECTEERRRLAYRLFFVTEEVQ